MEKTTLQGLAQFQSIGYVIFATVFVDVIPKGKHQDSVIWVSLRTCNSIYKKGHNPNLMILSWRLVIDNYLIHLILWHTK